MEQEWKEIRDAAAGNAPADLLIRNARILDVFNQCWFTGDVAVKNGRIVALGYREALEVIDAGGAYLTPGLADAHVHIESTLVTPDTLNDVMLPKGVMTLIADPHEIANVSGEQGIQYMLDASRGLELDVRIMLPSCVPSTPLETAGAALGAEQLRRFYGQPGVHGLAEVMNAPAVMSDGDMLQKIWDARQAGYPVDGHGATLDAQGLDTYAALGIRTDHETVDSEGLLERVRRGMWVHVRQGTVTQNLKALLPAVTPANLSRICFCTDDKHLDDLVEKGGIDEVVRLAIENGMEECAAFACATLHPAQCYDLTDRGAVAPGYWADLVLWDDTFHAQRVWKAGRTVAEGGNCMVKRAGIRPVPAAIRRSVHIAPLAAEGLRLPVKSGKLHVIGVEGGNVLTRHDVVDVPGGCFQPDAARDLAKLAVIERHHASGRIGLCAVTGFAMTGGAIGTTVAHDSHNLIVMGMNDEDMLLAARTLQDTEGGYVVVKNGRVLASLALEVAGLLTARKPQEVLENLRVLHDAASEVTNRLSFNPFQMLSFISLPVIPFLKLTDYGLVDVMKFTIIPAAE